VTDWPLPPLFEPRGPRDSDEEVVRAFLRHAGPTPHSERLHVEDRVLRVDGDFPLALWIGPRSVLLLHDLPDHVAGIAGEVAGILTGEGLTLLDEQQPLGIPVGMQYVGARTVTWDLWGADIDEAFADLRIAAVGGEGDSLLGGGGPPVF
jgi:hypothetical protein